MKKRRFYFTLSFGTQVCFVVFLMLMIKTGVNYLQKRQTLSDDDYCCMEIQQSDTQTEEKGYADYEEYAGMEERSGEKNILSAVRQLTGEEPEIRVLITNADGGKIHQSLQISSLNRFSVVSNAGTDTFEGGKKLDMDDYFSGKGIESCSVSLCDASAEVFSDPDCDGEAAVEGICVLSLKKGGEHPIYPGTLMVYRSPGQSAFYLINIVEMESYLPGVVSSEMPDDFGEEALKAQAVCARSYAMYVLDNEEAATAKKGDISWNLVDTTDDQVYLSGEVDTGAVNACRQTQGQVLYQDEAPVKPHYYSASWGIQADGAVFSGEETQYLKAAAVLKTGSALQDLEEMNQAFISNYQILPDENSAEDGEKKVFDQASPWFRWTCRIPLKQISNRKIKEIAVTDRGTGGYVSELAISYTDGTAELIRGAGSVRRELGFSENVYRLQDGSTRTGLSILPSAFFYTDEIEVNNGVQTVMLHGGGFGHGFGMSQYGAAGMAEEGYDYTEILGYYYEKTELTTIY
ncbi:MAG: SpoIID/LytB domain-containing protein [Lachnospiraceae bacterium]|nr:SpoIID/LytB domain-containing protein [Lachnospiraceae bacterium]